MRSEHYEKLERMYHRAPFNKDLGSTLQVQDGKSTVKASVRVKMHHAGNIMHSAYYFILLDNATFFAANSLVHDTLLLTQSFEIDFLLPVKRGNLTCEGKFQEKRTGTYIATGELFDEAGNVIGRGTGRFRRSKIMLDSIPEYSED